MRYILLAFLFFSFQSPTVTGKVVGVSDGDTIRVLVDGVEVRVRLAAIDAPEKSQDFGQVAKQFTSDKCYGKEVTLTITDTDKYGRKIAFVKLPDGRSLNHLLVENGLAWHYKRYSTDVKFDELETAARKAKTGLWSHSNPVAPWDFRKQ